MFFGLIALLKLPVRELPDIDPPIVSVTTIYPGANAAVVETEVTERLEEAINNIEGIKTLSSTSREEVSTITVEFELSRAIDVAAQDVRDRVSRVRGLLPDAIEEPIVAKQDADAQAVIWIGINSDRFSTLELSTIAEKQIKNRLQTIKGVSSIIIGGEQRFAMRLWLDSSKMAAHRLTVLDVERALREQNVELPSGRVENLEREMIIQTRGELKTAEEFNRLVLFNDGTKIVRLRDIGVARSGVENERTIARNNGRPCVFLGIVKQSKANTIEVAHGIKAEVERIRPTLPAGIEMVFNYDESIYVENSVHEVWVTLGIAFLLVVIVIYLFLRDFRSTIIPTIAIPVSIVGTFAILSLFGYSINILTMLALVLSIGVVVDDAIVVLENIFRHIEEGMPPMKAAYQAMEEIGFAIIAITVALVAVFLPLAFQKSSDRPALHRIRGGGGRLGDHLGLRGAVPVADDGLAHSQADCRPTRSMSFSSTGLITFWMPSTAPTSELLEWSLGHRVIILLVAGASLGLTVLAFTHLESEFLPEEDKGRLLCFVYGPEGATSEYTDRMLRKMEAILVTVPEVQAYGAIVAPAFSGPGQANFGIVFSPAQRRAHPHRAGNRERPRRTQSQVFQRSRRRHCHRTDSQGHRPQLRRAVPTGPQGAGPGSVEHLFRGVVEQTPRLRVICKTPAPRSNTASPNCA